MVELQIVVLAVAGSSPVGHPLPKLQIPNPELQSFHDRLWDLELGAWDFSKWCL